MKKIILILCSIFCFIFLEDRPCISQQTVFNVPSADVTPTGRIYAEQQSQFRPWQPGRNWLGTEYLIVGIGHNTEIGTEIYNISAPASHNITFGPGFKSIIPIFHQKFPNQELKAIVGSQVLVSVQGGGTGNWSFAELSNRVPKVKTRLTGGISVGTKQVFGRNTVSFVCAIEQPVTKQLTVAVDWYSGTNSNGLLIPGIIISLPKNINFTAGYQIPNNSRCGVSGFLIELAKSF